jgi:hypothetical protein
MPDRSRTAPVYTMDFLQPPSEAVRANLAGTKLHIYPVFHRSGVNIKIYTQHTLHNRLLS